MSLVAPLAPLLLKAGPQRTASWAWPANKPRLPGAPLTATTCAAPNQVPSRVRPHLSRLLKGASFPTFWPPVFPVCPQLGFLVSLPGGPYCHSALPL